MGGGGVGWWLGWGGSQVGPRAWRFLALVMDESDDTVRFYMDGAAKRAGPAQKLLRED